MRPLRRDPATLQQRPISMLTTLPATSARAIQQIAGWIAGLGQVDSTTDSTTASSTAQPIHTRTRNGRDRELGESPSPRITASCAPAPTEVPSHRATTAPSAFRLLNCD